MKKIILSTLLSSFLFLLLTACGNNNSGTAVQYLNALNERDLEAARALVCEERQDDVTMGLTTVDDPAQEQFEFSNIACAPEGSNVSCRFVVEQVTGNAEPTGVQQPRQVVFEVEDGKICGFEEQVAQ